MRLAGRNGRNSYLAFCMEGTFQAAFLVEGRTWEGRDISGLGVLAMTGRFRDMDVGLERAFDLGR